jgi:hypothetical protein
MAAMRSKKANARVCLKTKEIDRLDYTHLGVIIYYYDIWVLKNAC